MFEFEEAKGAVNLGRRVFLAGAGAALGGALVWSWRKPPVMVAEAKSEPGEVTIVQFSDAGQRLGKVKIAKVVKSEDEWAEAASGWSVRNHAACGYGNRVFREVLESARQRNLSLHLL